MTSLAVARAEDVENVLIDDISWVTFDLFLWGGFGNKAR
jgi:hypothetical protein